ncbi:IS6 family transposase, partial [Lacticaseibacillus paracasei]
MDFELRKHRDYTASYHFLKRLLTTNGRPDRLVTDQYRATLKAVKHPLKVGESMRPIFELKAVGPICIALLTITV